MKNLLLIIAFLLTLIRINAQTPPIIYVTSDVITT